MQRSLLILSVSFLLTACEDMRSPWSSGPADAGAAQAPVAADKADGAPAAPSARFSWEKDVPATPVAKAEAAKANEAPKDANKARIVSIREEFGLIALVRADKPEPKTRLLLTKENKGIQVEVVRADDKMIIVGIIPNQLNVPKLQAGDEVTCGVMASTPAAQ
jgi:hypothetical protein